MNQFTARERKILVAGLEALDNALGKDAGFWSAGDGSSPTRDEIARLVTKVKGEPGDTPVKTGNLMKDGKPYVADYELVVNALLLTDVCLDTRTYEVNIPAVEEAVRGWTNDERAAAFEWAACSHLHAGDNDDVVVPECPPHVEKLRPKYGSRN